MACYPGGLATEGTTTLLGSECGFGLAPRPHYDEEPLRFTCEPVCDTDADCRAGERCHSYGGGTCDVPCEGSGATPCAPPNRCVDGFCLNERRFARIDCDGDGVITHTFCNPELDCDCFPWGVCDPDAIGGCAHPAPGTE
jgi:hypothetical protein